MHHHIQRIARWLLAALLLALGQQALALSAGCQAINATFGTLQTFGPPDAYGEFVTDTLEAGERVMYRVTTSNSKAPPGSGSGFYIVNSDAPELTAESVAGDELDLDGTFVIPRTGEYGFGVWRESQSSEQIGTITRQLRCEEPAPPEPPAITAQPPSPLTLAVGGSGTISVTASNATAYQWEVDTGSGYTPIADGAPYTGTDTATLQITGATLGMNGYLYRVRVSGAVAPPALSDAAALAVTRAASTVTLGATPSPSTYGDTVTFTATVAGGAAPTGTVEFWEGATQLGSSTLASGTATFQTAALAAGNHTVTAAYTGDDNNAPASSSAQSVTVAQATQTVAFTSAAPVGAVVGGSYTPAASATSGLAAVISVDTASSGVCAMASGVVSFTAPGTCTLNADQPGDANHTAAPQVQQAVAVATAAPTVTLAASPLNPAHGATVTFTASVTGISPTGTVTFKEGGMALGSGLLAGGTATFQTAALAAGSHAVVAAYAGDGNNTPAISNTVNVTVAQATQTVAFTSTAPVGAVVGDSYTPAASATSGLAAVISVDTASSGVCAMASGVVSFTAPGTCTLNADQPGDANHTAAPQVQQPVAVGQAVPTVTLAASPLSPVYGATVTFTATVAGGASPTGTVTFKEGGTVLGTGALSGGVATYQTGALAAGSHAVVAAYAGDGNNAPASSSAQSVTVAQATQTVAFTTLAPVNATVGGSYTPAASATSGLTAVISVDAASSGVCAMASGVVSFTAPGTCTLNADQPGDANHTAAPQVQQAVAVTAAPSVPGAPTGVTATPGDAAVRVGWTAPPSPPDITGYTVTARTLPGLAFAGSCTAAADSANCVIDGLDNGTAHAFTVHAANAQGDGPESDAVHATPSKLLPTGTTVPGTSGGLAAVVIGGGQPGCALSGAPQFSDTGIPGGAPANASFPVGAFHFDAAGCKSDTLTVSITYPQPLPDNVQLMKYGPKTALATTSEWFPAPSASLSLDRKTVTYTVRDNGPGDSNPAEGVITDPFAPMLLPPPATHAVTATASPSAGGTVQCTPNPVTEGDTATCTASANTGYTFAAWTGACAGQGATCSLPNVTAPQASVAQFTPQAPAQPASIPTLGEWGLLLLSALAAAFGLRTVRRRA
jgi:hypothetical protein